MTKSLEQLKADVYQAATTMAGAFEGGAKNLMGHADKIMEAFETQTRNAAYNQLSAHKNKDKDSQAEVTKDHTGPSAPKIK